MNRKGLLLIFIYSSVHFGNVSLLLDVIVLSIIIFIEFIMVNKVRSFNKNADIFELLYR